MTINYRGDAIRANTTLGLGGVDISKWPLLDVDVEAIRANIMFNTFYVMSAVTQAQLQVDDAAIDAYQDESGIDTGASSDQYFNSGGKYYINQTPVAISNTANAIDTTSPTTTHTFSSKAIGTAAADRIVVVAVGASNSGGETVASMTIGGISATKISDAQNTAGTSELWAAVVPTGTTADIVVTFTGSNNGHCAISVFAVTNADSTASDTGSSTATPPSTTLDIVNNGGAIGVAWNHDASAFTWTGLNEVVEQATAFGRQTAAFQALAIGETGRTISADPGVDDRPSMALAAYTPAVDDMTLQSQAFTADAQPSEAHLLLFMADFTGPTYNTDFKAYVSRDGGTTWSQITLTTEAAGLPGQKMVQGTVDISGQPSGTSMKYKITTHNGHLFVVYGAGLFWK